MKIENYAKYLSGNVYSIPKEEFEAIFKSTKKEITEKGAKILKAMQDNKEKYNNIFNAKILGEILFMPPRSVSGSIKKLITDGYVEKIGINPVSYKITDRGTEFSVDNV